jgi:general secretion pathway protein E
MLRDNEIASCQDALDLLVDKHGTLRVDLLDAELNYRFFREFGDKSALPPVIPLLLWRSCFYLGMSPRIARRMGQKNWRSHPD